MSRSDTDGRSLNRFDDWIAHEYARTEGFTALVILVAIDGISVTPLRSTWFHVIGDEIDWNGVSALFSRAGARWDGVVFATLSDDKAGGPVADALARIELEGLTQELAEDRLVLNRHHFFNRDGLRLQIEEVPDGHTH